MVACRVSGALFWTVADLASSFLVFRKIFCNIDEDDDHRHDCFYRTHVHMGSDHWVATLYIQELFETL